MAITTYDELKSELEDWLRDDSISTGVDTFIDLAETGHRNHLRLRAMETRATATMDGTRYLPLPTGYLQMRRLYVNGDPDKIVQLTSPSHILTYWTDTAGVPDYFAVTNQLEFNRPGTSNLEMQYYKKFDALSSSNQTNWLITNAPGLYLYGALVHAAPYIRDDERSQLWHAFYDRELQALRKSDKAGQRVSGPIISRGPGPTP